MAAQGVILPAENPESTRRAAQGIKLHAESAEKNGGMPKGAASMQKKKK